MKKLIALIVTSLLMTGCASTGSFGELMQAGVQDAGVTGSMSVTGKACAEMSNRRGATIHFPGVPSCDGEFTIISIGQ